jgi:hypothetical protein
MAISEQRRQQKMTAKKSKQRKQQKSRNQMAQRLTSLAGKMTAAGEGEVLRCVFGFSPGQLNGMIAVTLVRQGPRGQVAFANFLVDNWCLGVKDCAGNLMSLSDADETIREMGGRLQIEPLAAADAHAIVRAGIEYGESLGFPPSTDCRKLLPIWNGIPIGQLPEGVEMGRDGRPFYIVGPYDDVAMQSRVVSSLNESVGKGNYDVLTAMQQASEAQAFDAQRLEEIEHLLGHDGAK